MSDCEVVVAGAGPAGCAAAITLARLGKRVMLLDKARFPRDKVCGDGFPFACVQVLRRLGVMEKFEKLPLQAIRGMTLSAPNGATLTGYVSDPERQKSFVLPRRLADEVHFRHACETGVEVLEQSEVVEALPGACGGCALRLHSGAGKRVQTLSARVVIGADGVHSAVARALRPSRRDARHQAIALRAYLENVEGLDDTIELHFLREVLPGYFWIFPTSATTANIGLGMLVNCVRQSHVNMNALFARVVSDSSLARRRLAQARVVERVRGWPLAIASSHLATVGDGVLLAGDAAGFVDPATGEGIFYALRSGELAAQAACEALERGDTSARALRRYEQLWRAEFTSNYRSSWILQKILTRPALVNVLVERLSRSQAGSDMFTHIVGDLLPKRLLFSWQFLSKLFVADAASAEPPQSSHSPLYR